MSSYCCRAELKQLVLDAQLCGDASSVDHEAYLPTYLGDSSLQGIRRKIVSANVPVVTHQLPVRGRTCGAAAPACLWQWRLPSLTLVTLHQQWAVSELPPCSWLPDDMTGGALW
jgi:hypothetical protein